MDRLLARINQKMVWRVCKIAFGVESSRYFKKITLPTNNMVFLKWPILNTAIVCTNCKQPVYISKPSVP